MQIMIGDAPSSLALADWLFPGLLAVLSAWGAVWLTNGAAEKRDRRQENLRRGERSEDMDQRDAAIRRDRGLAALALAEHLEDFVLECVDVVISVRETVWENPYDVAEHSHTQPLYVSGLKSWPELVDWKLLGLEAAVRAAAFRRKVQLEEERLRAFSDHADRQDTHAEAGAMAAKLGLEAWRIADDTRRVNGIAAFAWEQGWSGVEILETHVQVADERQEANRLAVEEMSNV